MKSAGIDDRVPGPPESPDLFCAVVDGNSMLLGGVCFSGPLTDAGQSHTVAAWNGSGGDATVESAVAARIRDGVVELRGAFVTSDARGDHEVVLALGRCVAPAMTALRARYVLALAPASMLVTWSPTGVSTDDDVPAIQYPDSRFRSRVLWWEG